MRSVRRLTAAALVALGAASAAQAQTINPVGDWQCGINLTHQGVKTATVFNVRVMGDGQFTASGMKSTTGSGQMDHGSAPFQAYGSWQIVAGQIGQVFVLQGVHYDQFRTAFGFASVLRTDRSMTSELRDEMTHSVSSCSR